MAFIKRAELLQYGRGFSPTFESLAAKQASATANAASEAQVTIFLSHSHKDRDLIEPTIRFLRSHGVKVYVDWLDQGMPDVVSSETAIKIKEHIQQNRKFLVMITENSKESRWVPWELGYADPIKGMGNIASFPVKEGEYDFSQNEYMKIYPKIFYVNQTWYIWQEDPLKITKLEEWLRS